VTRTFAVAVVLAVSAAGCGRSSVTVLSDSELPPEVYESPIPTVTPTPTVTPELPEEGTVYLVRFGRERLVPVNRTLQGGVTSLPAALLLALFDQPSPADTRRGLGTAIPPATRLNSVTVDGSTATVDLSLDFDVGSPGRELQLRVAQLVYTVTEDQRISQVVVSIEGLPKPVPDPQGDALTQPLTRADYAAFFRPAA
jgi:hypothetical protein